MAQRLHFFSSIEPPRKGLNIYRLNADPPYSEYSKNLRSGPFDSQLGGCRERAGRGELGKRDFLYLNAYFEEIKHQSAAAPQQHFARLKGLALQLAQILFVNNSIREGLHEIQLGYNTARTDLARSLRANANAPSEDTCAFYSATFTLQTAFDRLFVPPEKLGHYRSGTGEYVLSPEYPACIRYLDLCAIRELEAGPAERALCYNITTGWGRGIDQSVWDRLNQDYYAGVSPSTGKTNLFVSRYNDLLERMLPQFAYAKVRLADSILTRFDPDQTQQLVEIGAGSGAFAIDLLMAARRLEFPVPRLRYLGLEPSHEMIANFSKNLSQRTGINRVPEGFELAHGSLEAVMENPPLAFQGGIERTAIFCFSAHHIYGPNLKRFLSSESIRSAFSNIYILDGTERHGWSKMYYMWVDCESPEDFDNVSFSGDWSSETLWEEPNEIVAATGGQLTNAWCRARHLT